MRTVALAECMREAWFDGKPACIEKAIIVDVQLHVPKNVPWIVSVFFLLAGCSPVHVHFFNYFYPHRRYGMQLMKNYNPGYVLLHTGEGRSPSLCYVPLSHVELHRLWLLVDGNGLRNALVVMFSNHRHGCFHFWAFQRLNLV